MADENNKKREIDAVEYTAKKTGKYDIEKNDAIKTRALKEEEIRKVKEEAMKPKKRWPRSFDATWSGLALNLLRNLVIVALAVVIVYFIGIKAYKYVYSHYVEPMDPESTEQIEVVIKKHESLKSISKKLEEAGIIRSATVFKYYVDFSDMSSKLLAGKFKLSPSMTYDDIINVLKRPSAAQTSTRVTLIEGITIKEMEDKLLQEAVLESTVNMDSRTMLGERYYADYWFIKEAMDRDRANTHHRTYMLEGYMFPDTYDFYISSDTDVAVKKMLNRFKEIYTEEYHKRAEEIGMTTDEVVILASIIEKEAGKLEDFPKVSACFHNRLTKGMKLQSDATLAYAMPEKKFSWTSEELKTDTPYNTYLYDGLPVGPICNPGKAAIEAALYPDQDMIKEGYLYFVAANLEEGEILYAKTYEEHLKNVEYAKQFWPS